MSASELFPLTSPDDQTGQVSPALAFIGAGRVGGALATLSLRGGYPITSLYTPNPLHARTLAASLDVPAPTVAG